MQCTAKEHFQHASPMQYNYCYTMLSVCHICHSIGYNTGTLEVSHFMHYTNLQLTYLLTYLLAYLLTYLLVNRNLVYVTVYHVFSRKLNLNSCKRPTVLVQLNSKHTVTTVQQESPAVADKPARRLRKVCTVYVRAVGL